MSISTFKARLRGGARANLFRVTLNYPAFAGGNSEQSSFLVKGAQLPPSTLGVITIPYRGKQLQEAGDRTFEPWTVTVLNDNDFTVRNPLERWSNEINNHSKVGGTVDGYTTDLVVEQLNKNEEVVKTYRVVDAWPSNLAGIDVSHDSENTIEEFTCEFQMLFWESDTTT